VADFVDAYGDYLVVPNVVFETDAEKYRVEIGARADGDYCIIWLTPKQARKYGKLLIEAAAVAKTENEDC
jgi:hypothetical protein